MLTLLRIPFTHQKNGPKASVVAYNHNHSTWEVEAGGWQVPGQSGLHRKTSSQKLKKQNKKPKKNEATAT
jgi:hypothetical protein